MRLSLNQRGVSNILFPLVILAAIGLGVYLVQQQTELTPSAQQVPTTAPTGCRKVTPGTRSVQYKNCQSASENCSNVTPLAQSNGEQDTDVNYRFPPGSGPVVKDYPLKESVWDFGGGWKLYNMKGPRQSDGERTTISKGRFDGPNGKSYKEVDDDPVGANREATRIIYREDSGQSTVVEYAYKITGSNLVNYQGLPTSEKYDPSRSYAFVPETAGAKCDGAGGTSATKKDTGEACTAPADCKSNICTNQRCAEGSKANGLSCSNDSECQSGNCGSNNRCQAGTGGSGESCQNGGDCASGRCTNGRCTTPTPTPSPSPRSSTGGGTGTPGSGGGTTSSTPPSSAPSASVLPASPSPAASGSPAGSPVPISLTKAEITGFRNSYNALETRLGNATSSGNLRVVAGIARSELDSIISQLSQCPDDASVGTCLDQRFRTRFDFAKTAARLSAFYGIFNNVSGLCVKSDFGLNPLITATSQNNLQGRVNLCTEPTAAQKIWRIFVGGKFEQVLSTDTRWPANPTCATLPQDVLTHYRNAETLFNTQPGFTLNTLCDGKTLVVPGNDP